MKPDPVNRYDEEQAERIAYLVAGYLQQRLSESEHDELDAWITASDENQRLFEELTDPEKIREGLATMDEPDEEAAMARIKSRIQFKTSRKPKLSAILVRYSVAATILIAAGLLIFLLVMNNKGQDIITENSKPIRPGGNFASLVLGDGRVVNLYDARNGLIDSSEGSEVLKAADGQLSYEAGNGETDLHHTLSTPAGGQYSVRLPDGSRVWLNSSSSLKYPVRFDDKERVVELAGEGYFEIESHPKPLSEGEGLKTPFIVKVNGMEVEVLGTKFNVDAYADEETVKTTLLEGKVKVRSRVLGVGSWELQPGEQAKIDKEGQISVSQTVNIEEVIAWKNGMFMFRDAKIETIMKQVARWYDAEVVYEGKVDFHFNATIYRNEELSVLLGVLEETGNVNFRIEGRKVFVGP